MANENYINLIQKLKSNLSDGELLELFLKNASEETFHNVVADLFNGNSERDKKGQEIIYKLTTQINWINENKTTNPNDTKIDWTAKLNNFIECAEICGFSCRKTSAGTYVIYMND